MQNSIIRQQILKIISTQPQLVEQANQMLAAAEQDEGFDLEGIDEFIAALESTLTAPESYPQVVQMLIAEDMVDAGDLPEQFDRGFIISLLAALYTMESRAQGEVQGFARGGLAKAAEEIRSKGRDGDTILAHINPQEARMLKAAGGSGTINPETGLPEFKKLKKFIKAALPIALAVLAPGIGTAVGAAIGLSGAAASVVGGALVQGTLSKATGGDFLQGAIGGAIGGGLGNIAGSAANSALGLGLGTTGQQILGGAIGGGLQGAATGGNFLQGALSGAFGSGLGNLAGAGLNETLGLGLGDMGTRILGSGLSGAATSSVYGGDALRGGLAGALGGYQTKNPFVSALSGAAQAKLMGGDAEQGAFNSGLIGLAGKYKNVFSDTESSFLPGYKARKPGEDQQYMPFGPPQSMEGFDPNTAGLMNMNVSATPGAAAQTMRRFEPLAKGTFNVAPASQVDVFKKSGTAGTLGGQAMNLPVYDVGTGPSFVQRFIDQAQSGGYMNPQWSTYRPGVQLMASGPPSVLGVDGGATAYVPNVSYPRAADSVMLATNKQFTPQSAASVLSHELYHTKQPAGTSAYQGTRGGLQDFQQNLTNVLPHLQSKYGYSGAYDNMPLNKVPLNERMADLQSFQFNQGIDFAKDPVFQQQVLKDPYARAAYNASTIERTTRLDPRDLPPGVVTSSDFGPGGPPLMWNIQNKIKNMLPAPSKRFAKGGLAEVADMSRPFVGYRSAGRRPESQQDRRAAADAPLSALRGAVSGVLGAPGDIESLVRMLPGLNEQTVLPTSEDIERRLPMRELNQTPTGRAFTTAGQLGGGFYMGPGSPLRAAAALPSAVSRAGRDFLMSTSPVNVVKPKGGNWMSESVERAINPMRQTVRPPEFLQRIADDEARGLTQPGMLESVLEQNSKAEAMNRWLETKLGKYMRNEMATPEDPLRALAERGVLHVDPQQIGLNRYLASDLRRKSGNQAMGESEAARAWEDSSDVSIGQMPAGQLLQQGYAEQMPWLAKVPPETPVYMPSQSDAASNLGFTHLADELRNAINPASGLPENLLWKYQDLEKVTVPQAVERVAKINDWRAAQKAEADMARAMGPATQVVKEYPEQGFKWVELRQPKETGNKRKIPLDAEMPEMNVDEAREIAEDMAYGAGHEEGTLEFNNYVREFIDSVMARKEVDESYKVLEDALKYEGETMGHCVGGYCPDVVEGKSKIFSLRDKKGQPHVTIEVQPGDWFTAMTNRSMDDSQVFNAELKRRYTDAGINPKSRQQEATKLGNDLYTEMFGSLPPDEIVQIKGKANRAPKEEYLPAVQDFIRSGNFGKVGDLQNAGLVQLPDKRLITNEQFDEAISRISDGGDRPTNEWFMNIMRNDPSWWEEMKGAFEGFSRGGQVHGYQAGGAVRAAKATAKSIGDLVEKYTPEFKQWFAGSKAATPEGEPLRVFRGSARDEGEVLKNSWFTSDPKAASTFSMKGAHMKKNAAGKEEYVLPNSVVTPAYLSMKRPFVIDAKGADWNRIPFGDPRDKFFMSTDEIADFARDEKYDGVIFKNVNESDSHADLDPIDVYATFKPEQVKSTFNKKPTSDPRVGYAQGGQVSGANFPTDDFDPDRIDAIVGELHAMNAA